MAIVYVKKCHFLNAGRNQVTEERKNERLYTSAGAIYSRIPPVYVILNIY